MLCAGFMYVVNSTAQGYLLKSDYLPTINLQPILFYLDKLETTMDHTSSSEEIDYMSDSFVQIIWQV